MLEIGAITTEPLKRGIINEHEYQFILKLRSGAVTARSEVFRSARLDQGLAETYSLERFVNRLRNDGWQVMEQQPDKWYSLLLARGSDEELSALSKDLFLRRQGTSTARTGGLSVQAMWTITICIAVALFAVCILLAFSSELRITPV
jgi:hypothetical protein